MTPHEEEVVDVLCRGWESIVDDYVSLCDRQMWAIGAAAGIGLCVGALVGLACGGSSWLWLVVAIGYGPGAYCLYRARPT